MHNDTSSWCKLDDTLSKTSAGSQIDLSAEADAPGLECRPTSELDGLGYRFPGVLNGGCERN